MSEATTIEMVQTQSVAPAEPTATIADVNAAATATIADVNAAAPPADAPAKGAELAEKTEPPKELVSEKWEKVAKREARVRQMEREAKAARDEAARLQQEAKQALEWRDGLKAKKGLALLRELGIDPEEHLQDVLINGKPDPTRDAFELARQAKAEAEAARKALAERERRDQQARDEVSLRQGIAACAKFIEGKADAYPHAAKLLTTDEISRGIHRIHREALDEGVSLSFEQVGQVLELRAKAAYEEHERRRLKFSGDAAPAAQVSTEGPKVARPPTTLSNQDASRTAVVATPEPKSREERRRELIAELEARAAAAKR